MKRFISKLNLTRLGLLLGATAVIMLLLPKADHQSYSYELNQPWKYPLLTADFDTPILRDSTTARQLRDSIDANFIPFVKRDPEVAKSSLERFVNASRALNEPTQAAILERLLRDADSRGLLESKVYDEVARFHPMRVRISGSEDGASAVETTDASAMMSPARAFEYIDSIYRSTGAFAQQHPLEGEMAKALNICLSPNVITDSMADSKFRNQEYLNVNGATGVIKKGQRIVDRGEIITPQIFTNLNTYMDMLKRTQENDASHTYFYVGQALYILICFGGLYLFLSQYRWIFYRSIKKMTFLMIFITLFILFAILMSEYFTNGIYLVPFAAVPLVILIFFDSRTAIFSLLVTVMISAINAVFQFQFIFIELVVGMVGAFSIHQLTQRSQLLRTALLCFIAYCVAYIVIKLLNEGDLTTFSWRMIGIFAINCVTLSFAYILNLIIEKVFGFTSTVTLVELSDINTPLLRRLAEEAPGTFQHSMQVSTLASEAARAIGANTQLVRTGALYHDIGKLESPIFFTENQHGVNPHTGLNPETSAQKIISHVTGGLQIAAKAKLPQVIRDFIAEHHGKSVTRYFYNTAVNQNPDKVVDRSKFTYPGPNPRSKETTILMMADSVEAASRSLKDYSPEAISALVDKIITAQESDGLYKNSPISFRDIETIKETFKKRLATIYHSRVVYPEMNKNTATAVAEERSHEVEEKKPDDSAK